MAKKIVKTTTITKKSGRPVSPTSEGALKEKKGYKPVVLHMPIKLHARVKLTCMGLGTNFSTVARELFEEWAKKNKKALEKELLGLNDDDEEEEVEEDEVEESDEDEDEEESEDEEEDEE